MKKKIKRIKKIKRKNHLIVIHHQATMIKKRKRRKKIKIKIDEFNNSFRGINYEEEIYHFSRKIQKYGTF